MEALKKVFLGIFICLLSFFVMSHNVSAIDLTYNVEHVYGGYESTFRGTATSWVTPACVSPVNVKLWTCSGGNLTSMYITIPNRQYVAGDWITIQFSSNLGRNNTANHSQFLGFKYGGNHPIDVMQLKVEQFSDNSQFATLYLRVHGTFTDSNLYFDGGASTGSPIVQLYGNGENTPGITLLTTNVYHETEGKDYSSTLNSINNNLNSTNNKIDDISDKLDDQQEQEQEAYDNISEQTPEDLQGDTDNQASTNLVGLFQSFVTALTNITQANNCNLTLNFPSYAGGAVTVNVCQYKDKGGNVVAIFSSLTLIVFYIPLALKLLSIIYNEIRSFTNG